MLQVNMQNYASDALEDAMRLAQTKALNSFSFSDCLNHLNYVWADMYQRICEIDEGFYSKTVRITQKLTKLPPCLKSTIRIYAAQQPVGFNRDVFIESGYNDLMSRSTYHISGFDLFCPDAEFRTVWMNYIPIQPQIFFTRNNRDPKLYEEFDPVIILDYGMYTLNEVDGSYIMRNKNPTAAIPELDITKFISFGDDFDITYISCDYPYIFVSYRNKYTGKYCSVIYKDIFNDQSYVVYNPFDFTGRPSNVEYLKCAYNDKTGYGVVIRDYNDLDANGNARIKELGWTPDTLLCYPCPEMYRLLVARLADVFASINESNVMAVSKELTSATYAFNAYCSKDKSAWKRIDNVTGPTITDLL